MIFDFKEVQTIGQAFADEIFRVFKEAHPNILLIEINTVPEIESMIRRARGGLGSA